MAYQIIKFKRGLKNNLPQEGIEGQPYFTTDTKELYMGMGEGNNLVKIATQQKVITFVYKDGRDGTFGPSIKFPYNGTIVGVNANCGTVGDMDSILSIDKISESDYKNELDNWQSIFSEKLLIPQGKKFNTDSYVIQNNIVSKDDYFRLSMEHYSNIKNLVVEVIIEIIEI